MTVEALWHQEADRTEVVLRSVLKNSVPFFADIASILRCRLEKVLRWEKKQTDPARVNNVYCMSYRLESDRCDVERSS